MTRPKAWAAPPMGGALSLGSAIQASPAAYGNQIVVGTTGGMLYFVELR